MRTMIAGMCAVVLLPIIGFFPTMIVAGLLGGLWGAFYSATNPNRVRLVTVAKPEAGEPVKDYLKNSGYGL